MRLVTSQEMRQLEAAADAAGLSYAEMVRNAGAGVARTVAALIEAEGTAGRAIVVLVGPGNNGGDGLVAATALAAAGHDVRVLGWRRATADDPLVAALAAQPQVPIMAAESPDGLAMLRAWLVEAGVVVDALLGTGTSRPIEGVLAEILDAVGMVAGGSGGPLVVAVDVPTGLHADDGAVDPHTVPSAITVTFGFPKVGQLRFPGAEVVGELVIEGIGIPEALGAEAGPGWWEAPGADVLEPAAERAPPLPPLAISTAAEVAACLPARPLSAHKGSFGRALVVAGSANYTGAAYLAAAAACRAGTGLVTLALPASLQPIIAGLLPEATYLPLPEEQGCVSPEAAGEVRAIWADYDAVLLGPGLTTRAGAAGFVRRLLDASGLAPSMSLPGRPTSSQGQPVAGNRGTTTPRPQRLVVDADGLNLIAGLAGGPAALPPACVLTPHPGEMGRLTGRSAAEINADRVGVARAAAGDWGQIVVLKGAFSVIAAPDGRVVVNPFASPALATAGTGDILSGLIAGLLAQGMAPFEAAACGAHVHGLAGELAGAAIGGRGTLAGDVLARLAEAFREIDRA